MSETPESLISTSADDLKSSLHHYTDPARIEFLQAAHKLCIERGEKTKAKHLNTAITRLFALLPSTPDSRHSTPSSALTVAASEPKSAPAPATVPSLAVEVLDDAISPPPTPDSILGRQLEEQFDKANGAMREVILFGAMMLKAHDNVSTRGHDRSRGGGRDTKGEGFKAWLDQHAGKVAACRSTAYRFMALAEGVRDEFKLGKKADLTLLLTAPDEELSEKMRAQQRKILDLIEGKSQRQLLLELGGGSALRGGKREKQKPDETPEERHAREVVELREKFEMRVFGIECLTEDKLWGLMEDIEIERAVDSAEEFIAAARAWLKTPKNQRAAAALPAPQD